MTPHSTTLSPQALRSRIEHYYAAVPRLFSEVEDFGPLELFVRKEPGAPYCGGPDHARPVGTGPLTLADLDRVRDRQRERGVPEAFEWVQEVRPGLRGLFEGAGLPVAERPLMVLDPQVPLPPQP
ncbi:GNAT family N-acetyltransferase, partial [Streptomyces sp. T-3]|nr:GNAT family N-acetyltransferase [Streptomyces sp. T-3]